MEFYFKNIFPRLLLTLGIDSTLVGGNYQSFLFVILVWLFVPEF
jgi:hypothetical protein